jgi:hypothetical protein
VKVFGVDFTSAPRRAKPITVAHGLFDKSLLRIEKIEELENFREFEALLCRPGPWIGGFDFPFGLPREAVEALKWPTAWHDMTRHCAGLGKPEFKRLLDGYRESRLPGKRYATRRGDAASGAHPAVKLVNPPVGLMFFEGAPRLAMAGLSVPCLRAGDPARVALEAYPGLLIRKHLGIREPYKNDSRGKQTPAQQAVRKKIIRAIKAGKPHGIKVKPVEAVERRMVDDPSGDSIDAVICAVQASSGQQCGGPRYGLPSDVDPIEGWIVTAR